MNKMIKRIVAMVTCLTMIFTLMVPAYAASNATVTVDKDLKDHKFVAYQVLKGTQDGNTLRSLSWGKNINSEKFLAELKNNDSLKTIYKDVDTATRFAIALQSDSTNAEKVSKIAHKNIINDGKVLTVGANELEGGYYLIIDETNTDKTDFAYNASLLQVTNTINITKKTDKPTVEKKVKENTKYTTNSDYEKGYNDVADYCMSDTVSFDLIGSIPNMGNYDSYKYVFHDTMDEGFTLDGTSVNVYASDDKKGTNKTDITSSANITTNGQNLTIAFNDLKAVNLTSKQYIIVKYNAILNQNAKVGLAGNKNTVYLEYSNKPNDTTSIGQTPVDTVVVFTYQVNATKKDGDTGDKLTGAEFKLQNKAGKYATITDGKVTGWHDGADLATVITLTDSQFTVAGLDHGEYTFIETKAPANYQLPTNDGNKFGVTVNADTKHTQTWTGVNTSEVLTKLEASYTGTVAIDSTDVNTGKVNITIYNTKGYGLPETGGIGNHIFYGVGLLLLASAAFYFIRSSKKNK